MLTRLEAASPGNYSPSHIFQGAPSLRDGAKRTAIQFALALRLDRKDADALLRSAGFALSPAIPEDLIFAEAIDEGLGDLQLVSERLHEHGMKAIT